MVRKVRYFFQQENIFPVMAIRNHGCRASIGYFERTNGNVELYPPQTNV
jgi:hypothetical protein